MRGDINIKYIAKAIPDGINLDDERVAILGEELFTALHSSKERLYILKQNELLTKFMRTE